MPALAPDREALILAHLPLAWWLASRAIDRAGVLVTHGDADEIAGDAMLGLVKAGKDYRTGYRTSFGAYAYRRIRGEILDGLRARSILPRSEYSLGVEPPVHESIDIAVTLPSQAPDSLTLAVRAEMARDIHAALSRLTEREQRLITARFFQGMSHRSIAEHLGVSVESSWQIRAGAMRKLRADPQIRQHRG